jgi:hypothetical protein
MAYPKLSHSYEVEDDCDVVRLNYRRGIKFYNGDAELAPGIELYAASGHSAGLQFARVNTARGSVLSEFGTTCGKAVQAAVDERAINEFSLILAWKRAT